MPVLVMASDDGQSPALLRGVGQSACAWPHSQPSLLRRILHTLLTHAEASPSTVLHADCDELKGMAVLAILLPLRIRQGIIKHYYKAF